MGEYKIYQVIFLCNLLNSIGQKFIFYLPTIQEIIELELSAFEYAFKITIMKDISLGGINNKNIKKLKLINPFGFAGISFFE